MRFIILGAGGGLGSALARQLANGGHDLVLAGRGSERLEALAGELGLPARSIDAASFADVEELVAGAARDMDGLDGAVNCCGSLLLKPAHLTTEAEFQQTLQDNLTTSFSLVRAFGKAVRRGPASLVLVSSAVAHTGLAHHEAIAAAKGGVAALARAAAATYASRDLRVNAIAPGLMDTPLAAPITGSERALATSLSMHPLGRIGTPEEVAGLIAFLLTPASGWITGQVVHADGGLATLKTRA